MWTALRLWSQVWTVWGPTADWWLVVVTFDLFRKKTKSQIFPSFRQFCNFSISSCLFALETHFSHHFLSHLASVCHMDSQRISAPQMCIQLENMEIRKDTGHCSYTKSHMHVYVCCMSGCIRVIIFEIVKGFLHEVISLSPPLPLSHSPTAFFSVMFSFGSNEF